MAVLQRDLITTAYSQHGDSQEIKLVSGTHLKVLKVYGSTATCSSGTTASQIIVNIPTSALIVQAQDDEPEEAPGLPAELSPGMYSEPVDPGEEDAKKAEQSAYENAISDFFDEWEEREGEAPGPEVGEVRGLSDEEAEGVVEEELNSAMTGPLTDQQKTALVDKIMETPEAKAIMAEIPESALAFWPAMASYPDTGPYEARFLIMENYEQGEYTGWKLIDAHSPNMQEHTGLGNLHEAVQKALDIIRDDEERLATPAARVIPLTARELTTDEKAQMQSIVDAANFEPDVLEELSRLGVLPGETPAGPDMADELDSEAQKAKVIPASRNPAVGWTKDEQQLLAIYDRMAGQLASKLDIVNELSRMQASGGSSAKRKVLDYAAEILSGIHPNEESVRTAQDNIAFIQSTIEEINEGLPPVGEQVRQLREYGVGDMGRGLNWYRSAMRGRKLTSDEQMELSHLEGLENEALAPTRSKIDSVIDRVKLMTSHIADALPVLEQVRTQVERARMTAAAKGPWPSTLWPTDQPREWPTPHRIPQEKVEEARSQPPMEEPPEGYPLPADMDLMETINDAAWKGHRAIEAINKLIKLYNHPDFGTIPMDLRTRIDTAIKDIMSQRDSGFFRSRDMWKEVARQRTLDDLHAYREFGDKTKEAIQKYIDTSDTLAAWGNNATQALEMSPVKVTSFVLPPVPRLSQPNQWVKMVLDR